jgi:hypothetical protein
VDLAEIARQRGSGDRDARVDRHGRCREPAGRDPETAAGSIGGFKEGNARAWVMTVVRNTAYTWLGRNRSAALVITDDLEAVERVNTERGNQSGPEIETPEAALILTEAGRDFFFRRKFCRKEHATC